jgi:ADP-heptose:LPS heptosyltransferase
VASEITTSDISTDDICEAAWRIRQLDLIVCVDTMVAHLAGALGAPVWLLLHERCDWRWTAGRRSVWYPTMQLFRQTKLDDWKSVITLVRESLIKKAAERIPA